MEPWMRVHNVTTRQEWEQANTPEPTQQQTFYDRWCETNQRLRDWLQANSFHVERGDD